MVATVRGEDPTLTLRWVVERRKGPVRVDRRRWGSLYP